MRIYLDNAATTPLRSEVIETMHLCMKSSFGNPSSIHAEGRQAKTLIEDARKSVARHLNASIGEVFFTSGGTESNNMAIKCSVRDLGVRRIISSPTEHHCVLHSLDRVKNQGVIVDMVEVDNRGHLNYEHLESLLKSGNGAPLLVSLMHANNEIGTVNDLERISELCQAYQAWFHADTVQTIGHIPIDVSKVKIHFLSGGAHKFHGPKGAGFIYINNEAMLKPFIDGGAQERNVRGGTENLYSIVGTAKALDLAMDELEHNKSYIESLRSYFMEQLQLGFADIQFNGDYSGDYLYTILNVSFPPSKQSELLLLHLDIAGISASGGSACSSGAEAGSHVLRAISADPGRKAVRFSFSHFNTREEIDRVLEKLSSFVQQKQPSTMRV